MDTLKIEKNNVKVIAHRGLSGIELENTNPAFVAAGNRSYFGIETDVHVTNDGKYIIIHDDDTGRVSKAEVSVEGSDYETLRNIQLREHNTELERTDLRMPNLFEYINICKKYEKTAVLEIKNPMTEPQVLGIIEEIIKQNYLENTVFISFDFNNLVYIKKHYPNQKVQFLTMNEKYDEYFEDVKKYNMDLDIWYKIVTKEFVERCHNNGIEVNCWTVDDIETANRMIECGVDFITSNILE